MSGGPRRLEWDAPAPGDLFDHLGDEEDRDDEDA